MSTFCPHPAWRAQEDVREENEKLRREIAADSAAAAQRIAALTERIATVEALLLDEQGDSAALVVAIRLLLD